MREDKAKKVFDDVKAIMDAIPGVLSISAMRSCGEDGLAIRVHVYTLKELQELAGLDGATAEYNAGSYFNNGFDHRYSVSKKVAGCEVTCGTTEKELMAAGFIPNKEKQSIPKITSYKVPRRKEEPANE